ncbi:hypothetical protein JR316_0010677 [Psilocybe cubensis]|uniref:Uncharacterized protein n=3 Tax=Psilocybe cubensis TaxID=181762 RepID=A0A8H8CEJ5_PSICU|nr:hypothetical protein JR316_0010554 [Psilocybe cubensis]XP_047744387.1 hypothetical protein JR316_0010677 [Psilocybe cubensis]KAH9476641.1 hypothetical protein JR316_0010554 [Psilocybe cubensis]KAH9476762.1 hypothetical protein JR316_0010677 [Psilocybe cubensis]
MSSSNSTASSESQSFSSTSFSSSFSTSSTFSSSTSTPSPFPSSHSSGPSTDSNATNASIATSASLYLYTFLATLVLLLSVSAAIVIRSFVLRRRHRLMVEEAIRNGTWVPPAPPTRPVKVDLSKKPMLWEAYIDGKGDVVSYGAHGAGSQRINDTWKAEHSKEWDTIKPIAVSYLSSTTLPTSSPSPSGLATIPSVGSLHSTAAQQPSTPVGMQRDVEANAGTPTNASSAAVAVPTPPTSVRTPTSRPRAILSRVVRMLNPTPNPTSPLPGPLAGSNAGSNANLPGPNSGDATANEKLELKGPHTMRVAVLIAMPSPPSSSLSTSSSAILSSASSSTGAPGASTSPSPPIISHPLSVMGDDDEHPLPHLEVGVADVVVMPPDYGSGVGDAHVGKRKAAQRGSLASMATGSEGSEV